MNRRTAIKAISGTVSALVGATVSAQLGATEQTGGSAASGQSHIDECLPVRGFAIRRPSSGTLETFLKFIDTELAPARFNHLFLQVDYGYAYKTHPELHDAQAMSEDEAKKIVAVCKKHGIKIVPQVNLLGRVFKADYK